MTTTPPDSAVVVLLPPDADPGDSVDQWWDELVGTQEIAAIIGVSRQRVDQLAAREDFPHPIAQIKAGRIWKLSDIEKYAEQRGLPNNLNGR